MRSLTAHLDERDKETLNGMMVDRFMEIKDTVCDSSRKIKNIISTTKRGRP
jgi:hypothetical protein